MLLADAGIAVVVLGGPLWSQFAKRSESQSDGQFAGMSSRPATALYAKLPELPVRVIPPPPDPMLAL